MMATGQHSTPPQGVAVHTFTVRVLSGARGQWEVVLPDRRRPLRCGDLEEAQRVAYAFAERSRPCEVVVQDAYHRVVRRDLINGRRSAHAAPARSKAPPTSEAPKTHG